MKLSIITINFNNAVGLKKTIESVVNQTSNDFEYIVIDGGSNDGSVDIIKQYKSKINYWISERDNGIYHAMNKGIKAAKGEYCQFLNSGDCLVKEDVTQRMLENMPDTSILIGNMVKALPSGKVYIDKGLQNTKASFLTFFRSTLNHSPAYIRRELFDQYGFYDESLKIVSDWKWYLIVVGLNDQKVIYKDIDVCLFDMTGISTLNIELLKSERVLVLNEIITPNILADYNKYSKYFRSIDRLNTYYFGRKLFFFLDQVVCKIEFLLRSCLKF